MDALGRVLVRATLAIALGLALLTALPARAAADRAYTVAFTDDRQGDITGTGNTLMSCFPAYPGCAAARNGTGGNLNNNGLPMDWVDADGDDRTFNSSGADLTLPPGARVLFAELIYTGHLQQSSSSPGFPSRPAPDPGERNRVLFKPPGRNAYLHLTADRVDDALDPTTRAVREYQGIVDVTDLVAAAGGGRYWVANVQLGTGLDADQAGGWALAVAYEDVSQPTRNLTIFDGFKFVLADGPPVDIPLSGFQTPPSGPVTTNLGLVAIEGDLGTTGDSATINAGTPQAYTLTNAANPANNFFNSSISGRIFPPRTPSYLNQLGFDADVINATGRLQNGQRSTVLRLATSGDGFAPNGVSFATDLYAPSLSVEKSVSPVGQVHLGDVLTYTVPVVNTGLDAATNTILSDPIPPGTTYVPGSLQVVSGANAGAKTDAAGDDQAEYDATAGAVRFRLGAGANAASGGRLEVPAATPANATAIRFQVRVDPLGLPSGFTVVNSATVGFIAATLQSTGKVRSPDVVNPVAVPDLAITKTHGGEFVAGRRVPFTLTVRNVGDAPTFGLVTVSDPLADELTFATRPAGDGWDCSASTTRAVHCTRDDVLAPDDSYPAITFTARVSGHAAAGDLRNTATVSTPGDGDPTNDRDTNEGPLTRPLVDLVLRKFAITRHAFPGDPVTFLIFARNLGPDTATHVVVRDFLPRGLTAVALRPSRGRCAGATCFLGRMAAGARAVIVVRAVAGDGTGGRRLRDVAVVRGREDEVTLGNNRDTASVRIVPLVDLAVTKTTAEPTVPAGRPVSFTVVVTNHGPSTATHVTLTDALPAGLRLISATPLQGTCTGLTCDLGTLKSGASTQVVVEASSDASVAGATLTNTATVRANQFELDLANNADSADVTFTAVAPEPAPDVGVTKTSDSPLVDVGGEVRYRITATNRGPGAADSVLVTDTPDPGLLIVSVTPSQGSCSAGTPITCALGALAPGADATVDVVAQATAAGVLRNGVTVVAGPGGPGDGGVAGIASTRPPRLTLRKRATPRAVRPGDVVTYSLTVRARGTGTARVITVCDHLPRGVTVESYGGARLRHGRLCWTIHGLRAGRTRTLRFRVTVDPGTRGVLTNLATLTVGNRPARTARARVRVLAPLACPARVAPVATIAC